MTTERDRAVAAVVRAIKDEGRVPHYHRQVMAQHRAQWPTLWRALDALVRAEQAENTAARAPAR